MSSNPMPISRPRGPPSASSSTSSQSGSASTSVRSTLSTPPRSAMSLSSRHSLTMSLTNHGHAPLNLTSTHHHAHARQHSSSNSNEADIPFLGTPFAFALERPYEYPFPSPATESCPNLAATSAAMGSMGLGLVHIPPPATFVQSPTQSQSALPTVLPPPSSSSSFQSSSSSQAIPSSPGIGPFTARMPLRRRASYATGGPAGLPSPPVPPSLTIKARELNRRTSINGRNTTQR